MNKYKKNLTKNDPEIVFNDSTVTKCNLHGIIEHKSKEYSECLKLYKR